MIFVVESFRFGGCGREKLKSGVGLVGLDGGVGYGGGGCSFEGAIGYCY